MAWLAPTQIAAVAIVLMTGIVLTKFIKPELELLPDACPLLAYFKIDDLRLSLFSKSALDSLNNSLLL